MKIKELLEVLKLCDPESAVCAIQYEYKTDEDNPTAEYFEFEFSRVLQDVEYCDEHGEMQIAPIIGLFY